MNNKKVVLAFSGGLDTSFCVIYLKEELGYEVHSVAINTGGFDAEEVKAIEERAYALGVASHKTIDETEDYYNDSVKYLIFGNVLKNATYPLSVSAERVCQATAIANYAKKIGAQAVAHGSTGAGNDQVRFDMIFNILVPNVEIITPIRDLKLSREEEIEFLQKHGVEINAEKAKYSINKGLWGTSVGGKETLTSNLYLPEEAWPTPVTKTTPETVEIVFEKGEPVALNGKKLKPTEVIQQLQDLAQPFGIGRDIHVGDTIIGIKGRVGFEAAGPIILVKAHHTLEKHTLTKWQLSWKEQLAAFYGNYLHEGQFHDPVMRDMEAFLSSTQQTVSGKVIVELHPHRFVVIGIESEHDLMSNKFGSYGEMNNAWTGEDVKGFSKIFGNQVMIWHKVNNQDQ
ncbi:argininosuccinate synthase [Myroides marinus]|uniref:argininosuccinate synthase n=1 Tax=Myroides marinus TaxID=703342 RepID=UPI00257744B7|nr:argininosuccinate synthase [Myroides marinus]MDM1348007.1 argininosuccinate synthase [Myroides marinus]MDM1350744.1 argininosuccinate synthase [Myroides marinus]MDM1354532.1 argininosuccinate synthase [Myroides marinus]MDM1357951.1 argininosuccinate synthase [Myroides marinus]MDM1365332.1 argininosuccinate synthase [Myroides marinus]